MNLRGILTLAACFICTWAFGQATSTTSNQINGSGGLDFRLGSNGKYSIRTRIPEDTNIDYQEHLYDQARNTSIILLKGDTVEGYYRYNMETESLEHADSDKIYPWNIVKSFSFAGTNDERAVSFSNIKLVWPDSQYGGFIQDVSSSPFVKVKHYLEFIPSSYDPSTEIGSMKDEIKANSTKYLKVNDTWRELPNTKGAFFNMFGSYSDPLRKYSRKNKLRFKDPEDVGKMVSWVARNRN